MAPPRIQCLNMSRKVVNKTIGARAAFSTSQTKQAGIDSPRPPTSAELLADLDNPYPKTLRSSQSQSPQNPTSFTLPQRASPRSTHARSIPCPGSASAITPIQRLIRSAEARKARQNASSRREPGQMSLGTVEELQKHKLSADLSKQITRRWKSGDVYAPHDLSAVEMGKWKNRGRPMYDVFDVLDFKPDEHYRNFSIMSEYMTPMGRIKHSKETGLRPVNQRRISRAIRRSIGMGMMPSVHRHPEILQKVAVKNEQLSPFRANSPL